MFEDVIALLQQLGFSEYEGMSQTNDENLTVKILTTCP